TSSSVCSKIPPSPTSLSADDLHPLLHSFPTRRSSDLYQLRMISFKYPVHSVSVPHRADKNFQIQLRVFDNQILLDIIGIVYIDRSEEHTSELQSRFDLVCRLLLEKKNRRDDRRGRWDR